MGSIEIKGNICPLWVNSPPPLKNAGGELIRHDLKTKGSMHLKIIFDILHFGQSIQEWTK